MNRREFLSLSPLAVGLSPRQVSLFGASTERLVATRLTLGIQDLPSEFTGYTIAFLSDIHYGQTFSERYLLSIIEAVRSTQPDLVLLGGDYVFVPQSWISSHSAFIRNKQFLGYNPRDAADAIFRSFTRHLTSLVIPDGFFGVYGNHDRWHNPVACAHTFAEAGISLLVNESALITRGNATLEIYGTDDFLTGLPQLPKETDTQHPRIFLSHNPDCIAAWLRQTPAPSFDLALCGHTHGGQIALPFFGPLHYNVYETRLAYGMCRIGSKYVYTSRGLGTVEIPIRYNVTPELVVITLAADPTTYHHTEEVVHCG